MPDETEVDADKERRDEIGFREGMAGREGKAGDQQAGNWRRKVTDSGLQDAAKKDLLPDARSKGKDSHLGDCPGPEELPNELIKEFPYFYKGRGFGLQHPGKERE